MGAHPIIPFLSYPRMMSVYDSRHACEREWFGEIVRSPKLLDERINDMALRFGARAVHVYELGSIEAISAFDAPRLSNTDMPHAKIALESF